VRATPTLRDLLERAVVKTLALLAVSLAWMGVAQVTQDYAGRATDAQVEVTRPPAPGSPRALIEQHDCWTGAAPADMAGRLPGHAVVTVGAATPAYVGTNGVGPALEHVFEQRHPNITVHAFCR